MSLPCMKFVIAGLFVVCIGLAAHAQPPANKIAEALQPFVESHAIAGAVTLVADNAKVLSLDTVGFADAATKDRCGRTTSSGSPR